MALTHQRFTVWTGGQQWGVQGSLQLAEALPYPPVPMPLCRAALIEFSWGPTPFQFLVTACSIRTMSWGDESVNWLHCKAQQTALVQFDESTHMIQILVPAHYVTALQPNTTFRILKSRPHDNPIIGLFPPNQPAPPAPLPLEEIERVIVGLQASFVN